jgi:hypothetical protein
MYFIKKAGRENKIAAHTDSPGVGIITTERKTMVSQIVACWNNPAGSSWTLSSALENFAKSPCKATSVCPGASKPFNIYICFKNDNVCGSPWV